MEKKPILVDHAIVEQPTVCLDEDIVRKCIKLTDEADSFDKVDVFNLDDADVTAETVHNLLKNIEGERKRIKQPVIDLGRAIDKAVKDGTSQLASAKKQLQDKIGALQRHLAEEERKKREAEEKKARKKNEILPPAPKPIKSSSVTTYKVKELKIINEKLIPIQVSGVLLRPISTTAVRQALLDGCIIPGAELVEVEQTRAKS